MTATGRGTKARDIMSRDVVTVNPSDSIHEALQLMVDSRVSAVPVVDRRDHCIGVLSTTDLLQLTRELDEDLARLNDADIGLCVSIIGRLADGVGNERVDNVMTDNVAAIQGNASLQDAAREMLRNRVHHLPVVDQQNKLVGIISTMDLLAAFAG